MKNLTESKPLTPTYDELKQMLDDGKVMRCLEWTNIFIRMLYQDDYCYIGKSNELYLVSEYPFGEDYLWEFANGKNKWEEYTKPQEEKQEQEEK